MTVHKQPGMAASHIVCDAVLAVTPRLTAVYCREQLSLDGLRRDNAAIQTIYAYARTMGWERNAELGDRCPRHQPRGERWAPKRAGRPGR